MISPCVMFSETHHCSPTTYRPNGALAWKQGLGRNLSYVFRDDLLA